ncbi:MAG: hypothetical protein DRH11_04290 [Deltaproteobacteria bacterium]|nr:MAG: hypothetical protein DRH11_04290 [Deltaproteobacteria bacterium]
MFSREPRAPIEVHVFGLPNFLVIEAGETMMIRENRSVWIDSANIADDPGPFCMSFAFDLGVLADSIKKIGLLNPPYVIGKKQGRGFEVVSGYRRVLAVKALGWEKVLCKDISNSVTSPLEYLVFNLYDNLATRTFNDVEKGMILCRLDPLVPRKEILEEYMPLLGLPSHEPTLEVYLRVPDLALEIKEAFARGQLSFQSVRALEDMDSLSQSQVFKWISELKFNFNQQRQFLEILVDLALKDGISVFEFLAKEELSRYLEDPIENRPQTAKRTLQALHELRYPRLTRAERIFREKVANLNLPEGAILKAPAYFEAPGYCLEVRFRDGKSLKRKMEALLNIKQLANLDDAWVEKE